MFRLESKKHVVSHVVSHNAFRIISYSDDDPDSKFYTGIVTVMTVLAQSVACGVPQFSRGVEWQQQCCTACHESHSS